jgi:hypothetical protein
LILVISHIACEAAPDLVHGLQPGAAFIITASEFHMHVKANISINNFLNSFLIINGKKITPADISGIITTIPYFLPQEFFYMDPADRNYICSEMNAFFIYFLSTLSCKKVNPPTVRALTGPALHKLELMKLCSKNNIPVSNKKPTAIKSFTLIGKTFIPENVPEIVASYMLRLSTILNLPYLNAIFSSVNEKDYFLLDLITIPDLSPLENKKASIKYFINSC